MDRIDLVVVIVVGQTWLGHINLYIISRGDPCVRVFTFSWTFYYQLSKFNFGGSCGQVWVCFILDEDWHLSSCSYSGGKHTVHMKRRDHAQKNVGHPLTSSWWWWSHMDGWSTLMSLTGHWQEQARKDGRTAIWRRERERGGFCLLRREMNWSWFEMENCIALSLSLTHCWRENSIQYLTAECPIFSSHSMLIVRSIPRFVWMPPLFLCASYYNEREMGGKWWWGCRGDHYHSILYLLCKESSLKNMTLLFLIWYFRPEKSTLEPYIWSFGCIEREWA